MYITEGESFHQYDDFFLWWFGISAWTWSCFLKKVWAQKCPSVNKKCSFDIPADFFVAQKPSYLRWKSKKIQLYVFFSKYFNHQKVPLDT